jgi:hypothetical protein
MRSLANSQDTVSPPATNVAIKAIELVERKIWLPKTLYDSLPWFYLLAGLLSLAATLYISTRFWVVPQYFLFAAACLNLSIVIFRRRRSQYEQAD